MPRGLCSIPHQPAQAMSDPVSSIRNLGPAVEAMFARVGVATAEQLRELGADDGYRLVLNNGVRPHFIGYYALVMGLQGRPWNDCQGVEKDNLREKFDQLVADTLGAKKKGRSDIEAALDRLGVRAPD